MHMTVTDYGPVVQDKRERIVRTLSNGRVVECCGFTKRNGEKCMQQAGAGTDHLGYGTCKTHGGNGPGVAIRAAREQVVDHILDMKKLGIINEHVGPEEALLQEVGRSAAAVAYFDLLVNELEDPTTHSGQVLIEQWNEQRKIAVNVSKTIVRAGIAQRQVQIAEMQAAALVQIILAVVTSSEMGLSMEQQAIARQLTAKQLRIVAASSVEQ